MFTDKELRIATQEANRRGHAFSLSLDDFAAVERATHGEQNIPWTAPAYFRALILEKRARGLGVAIPERAPLARTTNKTPVASPAKPQGSAEQDELAATLSFLGVR